VKPRHPYATAVWWVALLAVVPSMCAQEAAAPRHTGVPQDWSQGHIVFSRDALALHPDLMDREPRVLHQVMQRWQAPNSNVFRGVDLLPKVADNSGFHSDWNVSTLGGRLDIGMYPAKFSFDPGAAPDCTNDYVVFGLSATGVTGGRANLVAFNNLYAGFGGPCGLAPTVFFAYNTTTVAGGKITTSPILSEDGTKIAFVESVPGATPSASFHVLTWTAGKGTIGAAAAPTMLSVPLFSAKNDATSSPWIDYASDTVYVGANDGKVYKITGVFKGIPTLVITHPWPVTVSTGHTLTAPILDSRLGMLMVGDSTSGNLHQINIATGALTTFSVGAGLGKGILAAPVVDVTNGTTFVVSGNDGTSAVLVEVDTASMTQLAKAQIGQGGAGGTAIALYEPAVSNLYFTNPSSGVMSLCGTGAKDNTPWQYSFGFTGRTVKTTPSFSQQLLPSAAARCTGWTEFFNPHVGGLGTDFFFFGLTQDCTGAGAAGGCVAEITGTNTTPVLATVNGGPSGIIVDNYSTVLQASSIYLTAEKVNTAYKFIQNGLH
jgi:hypothetical protein